MLLALGKRKLGKQVFVPFLGRIVMNFELIILHSSLFSFNFPPFSPVQGGGEGCCLIPFGVPGFGVPLAGAYWYAYILFTLCFPLQGRMVGLLLNA